MDQNYIIPDIIVGKSYRNRQAESKIINAGICMAITSAIFLCLILTMTPIVAAGPPSAKGMPPPLVTVASVIEKNVNPPEEFVGHVEAIQAVDLRARVQGYLEEIRFKEGAHVTTGDILYLIEQAPYLAQVDIDQARVAKAQATLTRAQLYLERVQTARAGAVSAMDIDTAASDELQAKAALQEAKATLAQSELNLSYTTVKAPVSGIIGQSIYTLGNFVGPDSGTLARIVQVNPVRVVFSISENDLPEIQKKRRALLPEQMGKNIIIRLRLSNGEIYPSYGRPDFMDNEVDKSTATIALRAVFDNPEGYLVPGQYVTVLTSTGTSDKMPVVPQAAVLEDSEGTYVFVVDPDKKAQIRRIKTNEDLGTEWAVESGLEPGENIIVQGIQKVRPGQQVNPVKNLKQEQEQGKGDPTK
jgi:RND family efflux transporter MFP subunit